MTLFARSASQLLPNQQLPALQTVQLSLQVFAVALTLSSFAYASLAPLNSNFLSESIYWPLLAMMLGIPLMTMWVREPGLVFQASTVFAAFYANTLDWSVKQAVALGGDAQLAMWLTALCFLLGAILRMVLHQTGALRLVRFTPTAVTIGLIVIGPGLAIWESQILAIWTRSWPSYTSVTTYVLTIFFLWFGMQRMLRRFPQWPNWLGLFVLCYGLQFGSELIDLSWPTSALPSLVWPQWVESPSLNWITLSWSDLDWHGLFIQAVFLALMSSLDTQLMSTNWQIRQNHPIQREKALFWSMTWSMAVFPWIGMFPVTTSNSLSTEMCKPQPVPWPWMLTYGALLGAWLLVVLNLQTSYIPHTFLCVALLTLGTNILRPFLTKESLSEWRIWLVGALYLIWGALGALLIGFLLAVVAFIRDIERNLLRGHRSLQQVRSRHSRSANENIYLNDHATQARVIDLQGAINFSVIHRLQHLVLQTLETPTPARPVMAVILHLHWVSVTDESATTCMKSIQQILLSKGVHFVLADGPPNFLAICNAAGIKTYATLDLALEWAEEKILSFARHPKNLSKRINEMHFFSRLSEDGAQALISGGTVKQHAKNTTIFKLGDKDTKLHLLLQGCVWIEACTPMTCSQPALQRVAVFEANQLVGEMAFLTHDMRSATARVHGEDATVWSITRQAFNVWAAIYPSDAQKVLLFIANELAERLRVSTLQILQQDTSCNN